MERGRSHAYERLGLHTIRKPNLDFSHFYLTCLYIETSGRLGRGVACHTVGCVPFGCVIIKVRFANIQRVTVSACPTHVLSIWGMHNVSAPIQATFCNRIASKSKTKTSKKRPQGPLFIKESGHAMKDNIQTRHADQDRCGSVSTTFKVEDYWETLALNSEREPQIPVCHTDGLRTKLLQQKGPRTTTLHPPPARLGSRVRSDSAA